MITSINISKKTRYPSICNMIKYSISSYHVKYQIEMGWKLSCEIRNFKNPERKCRENLSSKYSAWWFSSMWLGHREKETNGILSN